MAPRTKAIPLTSEQKQLEKDIKRINERIMEIAKTYGTGSYTYNQYYAAIKTSFPAKARHATASGVIQLSHGKQVIRELSKNKNTKINITRVLGLRTKGQLRKEARGTLRAEGIKKPTAAQIEERMKKIDLVNSYVESNSDMFYLKDDEAQRIIHIKGRRKTYDELNHLIEIYESRGDREKEMVDPFEGLL